MTTWAPPTATAPVTTAPVAPVPSPIGPQPGRRRFTAIGLSVLAFVLGNVAAIVAGGVVGGIAIGAAPDECAPGATWCGLGAAFIGIALAMLAGVIAYIAAGVVLIRQCRPVGERLGSIIAHLAVPCALVTLPGLSDVLF